MYVEESYEFDIGNHIGVDVECNMLSATIDDLVQTKRDHTRNVRKENGLDDVGCKIVVASESRRARRKFEDMINVKYGGAILTLLVD